MERKTEKLLRKIHIKDYTNSLEKVLENKNFSTDTKNLLLSMFYKIENSYKDYEKTKVQVDNKGEFLDKILYIIKNKCNLIQTTNEIANNKKMEIDNKNGIIKVVGNEQNLLKAILCMGQKQIVLAEENKILEPAVSYFLNISNCTNQVEVIRDFNGWSWDAISDEIENKILNIVYQSLVYLLDYEFIKDWIKNESNLADYLMLMQNNLELNYRSKKS